MLLDENPKSQSTITEGPKQEIERRSFTDELREMFRILVISLIIVLPIRFFIAQPFIVRGASMEPTYHDGEYLIVDELSYRLSEPRRGDVIVFRYPHDPRQFYIKRIIGLPGETVVIHDGAVGVKTAGSDIATSLDENYLHAGVHTAPDKVVTLKPDELFVLGDNRPNSSDSRQWGTLREEYLVGRARIRLWPLMRMSFL